MGNAPLRRAALFDAAELARCPPYEIARYDSNFGNAGLDCGSTPIIRKDTRRKKLEIMQLWQCKLCRRVFAPAPSALRYKTHPLRLILDGVTFFPKPGCLF